MNPTSLYIEITQSTFKLLNDTQHFEFTLDRLPTGRLSDGCKQKLTASLQDFLKRKSWQPKFRAWCAISARGVLLRRLTVPSSSKEELQKVLRLQVESEFPLPPEQLAWGYQQVQQGAGKQQEVVVAAVKKELVADYFEVLSTCGIAPIFTVAALARSAVCPRPPQSYAVLNIGRTHSELLSFENAAPVSIRVLPFGDESIARGEMQNGPECINPKWIGQKLYVTGNNPCLKQIAAQLSVLLGDTVESESVWIEEAFPTAAIQGLKQSDGTGAPLILQFNESSSGIDTVARPTPWKWGAIAAALLVALLSLPYAEALLLKSRYAAKLEAANAEKGRLDIIDRELSFLQDLKKSQSPYLDTVYLLADAAPKGTRFDSIAMNRRGEVSFKGNMGNGQQVTDFRAKLIASGFFSTVVVDEQSPTPDRQKVVVKITAQWKPTGARKPVVIETPKPGASPTNAIATASTGMPAKVEIKK
ncbi:MAG: hypothetical protein H0X66_19405 [Verrucomicrobia bacterium]|nr:hypothetical protein [Verrucomicrobiota bacterium]